MDEQYNSYGYTAITFVLFIFYRYSKHAEKYWWSISTLMNCIAFFCFYFFYNLTVIQVSREMVTLNWQTDPTASHFLQTDNLIKRLQNILDVTGNEGVDQHMITEVLLPEVSLILGVCTSLMSCLKSMPWQMTEFYISKIFMFVNVIGLGDHSRSHLKTQ